MAAGAVDVIRSKPNPKLKLKLELRASSLVVITNRQIRIVLVRFGDFVL